MCSAWPGIADARGPDGSGSRNAAWVSPGYWQASRTISQLQSCCHAWSGAFRNCGNRLPGVMPTVYNMLLRQLLPVRCERAACGELESNLLFRWFLDMDWLERSLELAREKGLLKGKALRLVLDTTPILGRGAVANGTLVNGDPCLINDTVSVFDVKTWKVPMATAPVATKVSLGGPPHSGAGAGCEPLGRAGRLQPLLGTQHPGEH